MKVTIKKSKVNAGLIKKLEAAGIIVTLIISSSVGAVVLERGDLNKAVAESKVEASESRARVLECIQDSEDIDYTLEDVSTLVQFCQAGN